jgi:hypothetical protein
MKVRPARAGTARGHFCRICGRRRPNERFSGKGHRIHVCSDCSRLPKETRTAIEAGEEIHGFLFGQSHISARNLERLRALCGSDDAKIAGMAAAVHAVALVAPFKRKRFRVLARSHRHLIHELAAAGLIVPRDATPDPDALCDEAMTEPEDELYAYLLGKEAALEEPW